MAEDKRLPISDTQAVPEGDDPADQLKAELRAAREVLAAKEMEEGYDGPPHRLPSQVDARLASMGERQLEEHIDRLEADVQTVKEGWEAGEGEE